LFVRRLGLGASRAAATLRRVPSTRLLALRHGESEWNVAGRWQGQADTSLSDGGRRQALLAAEQLGSFDGIWSSPLQRAAETAAIIAAHIGIGPVLVDDRLGETDVGSWEGMTHAEIEAEWPGYIAGNRRPPDAEPLDDVARRAEAAFVDIAATVPGGEVLVITHAGLLRTLCRALGSEPYRFDNLDGSWFIVEDGQVRVGERVHLVDAESVTDAL
jgi:probable phosphoglycerate mutase